MSGGKAKKSEILVNHPLFESIIFKLLAPSKNRQQAGKQTGGPETIMSISCVYDIRRALRKTKTFQTFIGG